MGFGAQCHIREITYESKMTNSQNVSSRVPNYQNYAFTNYLFSNCHTNKMTKLPNVTFWKSHNETNVIQKWLWPKWHYNTYDVLPNSSMAFCECWFRLLFIDQTMSFDSMTTCLYKGYYNILPSNSDVETIGCNFMCGFCSTESI